MNLLHMLLDLLIFPNQLPSRTINSMHYIFLEVSGGRTSKGKKKKNKNRTKSETTKTKNQKSVFTSSI